VTAKAGASQGATGDELETLDTSACWDLVRSRSVGRFAVNRRRSCPLVVPVNYVVDEETSIVFRSGAGSKLDAAQLDLVAFQVDEIDPFHHTGWSVLVEGTARWLYEEQEPVVVETWAPGDRPYVIRISPTRITGRRIHLAGVDTDARGYR
jgi:nitroimidazol reductase NimA-like FMN-containing flavoprotein (pyridoxamine 5'-phosphate oxidase superfamily)